MRFGSQYGRYELDTLPGNGNVAVSHGTVIWPEFRGKGFGKKQHELRLAEAKNLGYKYVICTVRMDNGPERHILKKFGWELLAHVDSDVELWGRCL